MDGSILYSLNFWKCKIWLLCRITDTLEWGIDIAPRKNAAHSTKIQELTMCLIWTLKYLQGNLLDGIDKTEEV